MTTRRDVERKVDDLEENGVDDRGYTFVELLSDEEDGGIYEVVRETKDGYLIRHLQDGVVFHADETPEDALEVLWKELSDGTSEDAGGGAV